MKASTDYLMANLEGNDKVLNEVTGFLFKLLEKRSLIKSSEYLALKMLTQNSCTLNDDLARQLETYRKMNVGNTAPDILFSGQKLMMGNKIDVELKLSDLKSTYTLIVFGASWCPKCTKDLPAIKEKYLKWKLKDVEIIFISLDKKETEFTAFVKEFPFLSVCDFKSWESETVQDYYVFSTPTMFLLDKNQKILSRPSSVEQVDAWVNYKL
jgi:peroxiredoxin